MLSAVSPASANEGAGAADRSTVRRTGGELARIAGIAGYRIMGGEG